MKIDIMPVHERHYDDGDDDPLREARGIFAGVGVSIVLVVVLVGAVWAVFG